MTTYHVQIAGSVYGPFTFDQLQQLAASGRINSQAEISTDRQGQPHAWMPAASILGPAVTRAAQETTHAASPLGPAASTRAATGDTRRYLETLRNQTRYPFYRTTILICTVVGYFIAVLPILGLLYRVLWTGLSSVQVYEPFAVLFATAVIGVFVTVMREMFSMYADFVDSTIEHHSRNK